MWLSLSGFSRQASTSGLSHQPGPANQLFPVGHYTVPEFPIDVKVRVGRVVNGDVPEQLKRRIVDLIFFDLTTGTTM